MILNEIKLESVSKFRDLWVEEVSVKHGLLDRQRLSHIFDENFNDALIEIATKEAKNSILGNLIVTTATGNVFDANVQARLDISNAIMISDAVGITETVWRLADDSEVLVTVAELKEALMLALTEYARIKGIGA